MNDSVWHIKEEAAFAADPEQRSWGLLQEAKAQLEAGANGVAETTLLRYLNVRKYSDIEIVKVVAQLYQQRQDIPALKELWKRVAIAALERQDYNAFLEYAYISIYAENFFSQNPNYQYSGIDADINTYVRMAARLHPLSGWVQANRAHKTYTPGQTRLKVGFVLEGFSQVQAPIRAYFPFAQHYDEDRFECFFYSRYSMSEDLAVKEKYIVTAAMFEAYGCHVWSAPQRMLPMQQIEHLVQQIVQDEIDILVFQTTYFVPTYNLLSALRPAPFQAAIEHQQPEFSANLDLVFTARKASLDSVSEIAPYPVALNTELSGTEPRRADFGIPDDAVVSISANREVRYAQPDFWQAMQDLLRRNPNAYFLAVGLSQAPGGLEDEVRSRVVTPGFRSDALDCMALADIYVDIFPSGGGVSLIEGMTAALPVVCFAQDYAAPFRLNEEIISEYVDDPVLVVPTGQTAMWQDLLDLLIQNESFRRQKGQAMLERSKRYDPKRVSDQFFATLESSFYRRLEAE